MKLRNKKTGEIKDWDFGNWYQTILNPENKEKYECNLNDFIDRTVKFREEWEDYEEPKVAYWIDSQGDICVFSDTGVDYWTKEKQIGNYFETKEEAELAICKLKAWKRLRNKGFRFKDYDVLEPVGDVESCGQIFFRCGNYSRCEIMKDLDLLFGGEND